MPHVDWKQRMSDRLRPPGEKCVCYHLQRGDAKLPDSPRRRKPVPNMRLGCVSANAARTRKVSARVWRTFRLARLAVTQR
jgi:hypothetical protein